VALPKKGRKHKPFDSATKELMVFPENIAKSLLKGVRNMKESVTYQAILREGKAKGRAQGKAEGKLEGKLEGRLEGKLEEAMRILVRQGRKRFGPVKADIKSQIESISELDRLEQLIDRVLEATSWDDLIRES
jgi:predicted transposase YdaD